MAEIQQDAKKRKLEQGVIAQGVIEQRSHDDELHNFQQEEEASDKMVLLIGSMYRDYNCVVEVFGRRLVKRSSAEVMEEHQFIREHFNKKLTTQDTYKVLVALHQLGEHSMRYDIGKAALLAQTNAHAISASSAVSSISDPSADAHALVAFFRPLVAEKQKSSGHEKKFFQKDDAQAISRTHSLQGTHSPVRTHSPTLARKPQDIILYGFGRIGRLLARMLVARTGSGCKMLLRAIVVRQQLDPKQDLEKRASLLKSDSVHGSFPGE